MSASKTLLFDLDGTLVDPGIGIIGSFRGALEELGVSAPPHEDLGWIIGPPLRKSFAAFLPETRVEDGIAGYRSRYNDQGGMFNATPYEGIHAALEGFRAKGFRIFVCTAKPAPFARKIIPHFDFAPYFDGIYGAELDGRFDDKGALIAHMLTVEGFAPETAIMIGDRANDTGAASRNGLRSVGVTWGYGSAEELTEGGATVLCEAPRDLPQVISALL
ncbi:HAD hydrolase-like protein [Pseudooceanicola sp. CBS1P-1]|uniref:HAD hydrolase-like protein n=1 Tax=Pseudooceanicola albus TaxID=2692189 RepID=A0A6L7FZY0_9RHOB|nr:MULTISPECIES: HAD hydrolase-like protein [Pseudooceanicola]MBT9383810.1 HAD hydrolase-like protein [Pseudooceanicola endophyticus]MXN17664.1 HAD hydrolase-like protein [Pseudooceanicola albus]